MAALADYIDLRTAVVEHAGTAKISDVLNRLTLMAEDGFNRTIRHRDQVTAAVLAFTDGLAPLPDDYQEMIGLYSPSGCEIMQQGLQRGSRSFYSIDSSNVRFRGASGDYQIEYYAKIPTLTASMTSTNWLLDKFPDVYLYGVGLQAAIQLRDADLVQATMPLLDGALNQMKIEDDRARYSRAVVVPRGVNP